MSTSISIRDDGLRLNACLYERKHGMTYSHVQSCRNYINDIDHYLFKDRTVSTSDLVARVLPRTFLDYNFVSMVKDQLNTRVLDSHIHDYPINSMHYSDISDAESESDAELDVFMDFPLRDPVTSMDFSDPSSTSTGNDDNVIKDHMVYYDNNDNSIEDNDEFT